MYAVTSSVPNGAERARGNQRRSQESDLLSQLPPCCRVWRLAAPDTTTGASATRFDTSNVPARERDRHRPLPRRPHAAHAQVATRYGPAGNRPGKLCARQGREVMERSPPRTRHGTINIHAPQVGRALFVLEMNPGGGWPIHCARGRYRMAETPPWRLGDPGEKPVASGLVVEIRR